MSIKMKKQDLVEEEKNKDPITLVSNLIERNHEQIALMFFHLFDEDKNGYLNEDELYNFESAMRKHMKLEPIPKEDFHENFAKYDTNGDGKVSKEEFVSMATFVLSPKLPQ